MQRFAQNHLPFSVLSDPTFQVYLQQRLTLALQGIGLMSFGRHDGYRHAARRVPPNVLPNGQAGHGRFVGTGRLNMRSTP